MLSYIFNVSNLNISLTTIIAGLNEEMLRCAAQNLDEKTFYKDEVIVRQGDIGDTVSIKA